MSSQGLLGGPPSGQACLQGSSHLQLDSSFPSGCASALFHHLGYCNITPTDLSALTTPSPSHLLCSLSLVIPNLRDSELFHLCLGCSESVISPFTSCSSGFLLSSFFPGLPLLNSSCRIIGGICTAQGVFRTETAHLKRSPLMLLTWRSNSWLSVRPKI